MKNKLDKLKIQIFVGILIVFSLGTVLQPKNEVSYFENRALAKFPAFSAESVFGGTFFPALERYVSDHIIGRDRLLKLNTAKELQRGAPVVNDVVVTEDCLLPYHKKALETYDAAKMKEAVSILDALNRYCVQKGIRLLYVGIPEQGTAMRDAYPPYLISSGYADDSMPIDFFAQLSAHSIDYIEMKDYLSADYRHFYSTTDHHYNLYGAYETYQRIIDHINENYFSVPQVTDLTITPVQGTFLGSRNRKLFGLYPNDDKLYTYQAAEEVPFTRLDSGKAVESAVFDPINANSYTYYMGGDKPETVIRTNRPVLPDVLVVGDSFTNALETILYRSFDETRSLDFRYYQEQTIYEYLESYTPDVLLIVRDDLSYIGTEGNGNLK